MTVELEPRVFPNQRKVFIDAQHIDVKYDAITIVSGSGLVHTFVLDEWRVHVGKENADYVL